MAVKLYSEMVLNLLEFRAESLTNRRCFVVTLTAAVFAIVWQNSVDPWWIFQAHVRLALIQLLPLWDWSKLYPSGCLIPNAHYFRNTPRGTCNECEWIKEFSTIDQSDGETIASNILLNIPMVLSKQDADLGKENLPMPKTRLEAKCNLQSSMSASVAQSLISRVENLAQPKWDGPSFPLHWFAFWENCDKKSSKQFRRLFRSHWDLLTSLGCSGSTWVLLAQNYTTSFKPVFSGDKLILFWQMFGSSQLQLEPFVDCQIDCPLIKTELAEGQLALVSQWSWDISYKPARNQTVITLAIGCD